MSKSETTALRIERIKIDLTQVIQDLQWVIDELEERNQEIAHLKSMPQKSIGWGSQ